jgi:hypothetical protein
MRTTYTGGTWAAIHADLYEELDSANGRRMIEGEYRPQMTNLQAIAILQAYRKLAKAWKVQVPLWPELWYAALGYLKAGDRFKMTTAHANAQAPDHVVPFVWEATDRITADLERKQALPLLLVLDTSFKGYEAAAKEAYAQLKKDRKPPRLPIPGHPPLPDKPPSLPKLPLPTIPKPDLRGAGMLLALLLIAYVLKDSKRR